MGVLDDAIRDHLDLKRRRGADPGEIERAEREALGPVRRGPEAAVSDAQVAEAVPLDEDVPVLPFDASAEDAAWEHGEPEPDWDDEPEAVEHPPLAFDRAPALEPEPEPPRPAPEPHAAPGPPALARTGDETVEYRVEDALAQEGGEEDVLEETPEFLQDTPDHDRLWFEQRPPRDFDFDG